MYTNEQPIIIKKILKKLTTLKKLSEHCDYSRMNLIEVSEPIYIYIYIYHIYNMMLKY